MPGQTQEHCHRCPVRLAGALISAHEAHARRMASAVAEPPGTTNRTQPLATQHARPAAAHVQLTVSHAMTMARTERSPAGPTASTTRWARPEPGPGPAPWCAVWRLVYSISLQNSASTPPGGRSAGQIPKNSLSRCRLVQKDRTRQDSNLRGQSPIDFESIALTTRPRVQLLDPAGTRTLNLPLRRRTPYPLGHRVNFVRNGAEPLPTL